MRIPCPFLGEVVQKRRNTKPGKIPGQISLAKIGNRLLNAKRMRKAMTADPPGKCAPQFRYFFLCQA